MPTVRRGAEICVSGIRQMRCDALQSARCEPREKTDSARSTIDDSRRPFITRASIGTHHLDHNAKGLKARIATLQEIDNSVRKAFHQAAMYRVASPLSRNQLLKIWTTFKSSAVPIWSPSTLPITSRRRFPSSSPLVSTRISSLAHSRSASQSIAPSPIRIPFPVSCHAFGVIRCRSRARRVYCRELPH